VRRLYLINLIVLFTISAALYGELQSPPPQVPSRAVQAQGSWYQRIKPYCNPVEVGMAFKRTPPPTDETSQAYAAACYALAGKIEKARQKLDTFPRSGQSWAANIVFNVAHPIADGGDDQSAGPIMELVVRFSPNHYMALYHAGISLYATGKSAEAERHLIRFLGIYKQNDGWTRNAQLVLEKIRRNS